MGNLHSFLLFELPEISRKNILYTMMTLRARRIPILVQIVSAVTWHHRREEISIGSYRQLVGLYFIILLYLTLLSVGACVGTITIHATIL